MEKQYNESSLFEESKLHPVVKLLTFCREELQYAISIKADVEKGTATIICPVALAFRLAHKIWQTFVYRGYGFDRMIVKPNYKSSNNVAKVRNVTLSLVVNEQPEDNHLNFYFSRK